MWIGKIFFRNNDQTFPNLMDNTDLNALYARYMKIKDT